MVDGLYTYMKENKETYCNCLKLGRGELTGRDGEGDLTNDNISLFRIVNMNHHHITNISE
jgi:hypothetical protein